jgi:hypothetical protein
MDGESTKQYIKKIFIKTLKKKSIHIIIVFFRLNIKLISINSSSCKEINIRNMFIKSYLKIERESGSPRQGLD